MSKVPTTRCPAPEEAAALSQLAIRSKAHWGYSDEFMNSCRDELTVSPEELDADDVEFCVLEVDDKITGYYALKRLSPAEFDLEGLFVDPGHIGNGYGGLLLSHALSAIKTMGGERLQIQSDPYAVEFYVSAGAREIGTQESGSIPGRFLPLLVIDIVSSDVDVA